MEVEVSGGLCLVTQMEMTRDYHRWLDCSSEGQCQL